MNLLGDILDTWQSTNDWLKLVFWLTPFAFVLIWRGQTLRHRRLMSELESSRDAPRLIDSEASAIPLEELSVASQAVTRRVEA